MSVLSARIDTAIEEAGKLGYAGDALRIYVRQQTGAVPDLIEAGIRRTAEGPTTMIGQDGTIRLPAGVHTALESAGLVGKKLKVGFDEVERVVVIG